MTEPDLAQIEAERKRAQEELRRRGELLLAVADEVPDAIFVKDRGGKYLLFNRAASRLTGTPAAEVLGRDDTALFDPDSARVVMDNDRRVMSSGVADTKEEELTAAGVTRTYLATKAPYHDEHGNVVGVIGISRDITDRKRTEDALRESEGTKAAILRGALDAIVTMDHEGKVRGWNPAAERIFRYAASEVIGRSLAELIVPPAQRPLHVRGLADFLATGQGPILDKRLEMSAVRADGSEFPAELSVTRIQNSGRPLFTGFVRDVTERKRAEETLHRSERNFATLVEKSLQGIAIFQGQRLVYANPAQCAHMGYPVEELQAMSREQLLALVHPLDRPITDERARKRLAGKDVSSEIELRIVRKDGVTRWTHSFNNAIEFNGLPAILSTTIDITERKRAEEAMRRSERLLRQVLEALPVGVVVTNLAGDIILGNPASARIWGGTIIDGAERRAKSKGWRHGTGERIGPDDWASRRAFTDGLSSINELIDIESFDGVRKIIKNSAAPIRDDDQAISGAVVINEDVTDVLRLEDQFVQAQKMEAIGHLAGGVAHDFNNLLTIINGYSEIIKTQLPADSPVRALVHEIGQAGERAASLTRQLLAFSRKQVLEPKVLNLNAVVTDAATMLQRLLGEDLELNTVLEPGLARVKADPGQIEQVLMNLAVNARDAMPQGGKLTIETANTDLDDSYTRAYPDLRPGPYVALTVSDTGTGMGEATKARIFEPFFTTKGPGKGTGLGLATVYGIVKQSNGHVAVYSEVGQGTTFKIYLPVVEEVISSGKSSAGLNAMLRGTETILLAEDEPALRALVRHVLTINGYTVLEAGQGDLAIRIAEAYKGTIHLLVTDVVMPVMSGRQLAERLVAIRPGLKVLYLSGYTDDAVVRHGILQAETAFLQKPFTPSSLAAKVREVLDQRGVEGPPAP
jgi:two-component system cell cycle sensor histidine kinase/response regulator CckA